MSVILKSFTDPFCSWCWSSEPVLRRVQEVYGEQVKLRFVMGGLVDSFDSFCDAANDITQPEDVASHWKKVADSHEMPMDPDVWLTNPPDSSYPASIAVKAAEFQGTQTANRYLRRVREAIMVECRDISDREVLVDLAADVDLDVAEFESTLESSKAREKFQMDLEYTRDQGVRSFPTFLVESGDEKQLLGGSQPFERLASAIETVGQDIDREPPRPVPEFVDRYAPVATKEVAEVYGMSIDEARRRLENVASEKDLQEVRIGPRSLWQT